MLKKITIQNIISASIVITVLLLLVAIYSYYLNHKKLLQLQDRLHQTETKLKFTSQGQGLENMVMPDAREIFRPEVLGQHPVNGLQLSVMEYLFSTYNYNLYADDAFLQSELTNLMSIRKKFEIHYARHRQLLVFGLLLVLATVGVWVSPFLLRRFGGREKENGYEFGPKGFFKPAICKGSMQYFEGRVPGKIPSGLSLSLIRDIWEIHHHKGSIIKNCYKIPAFNKEPGKHGI